MSRILSILLPAALALSAGCARQADYDFLVWHAITTASGQNDGVTVVLARDLPEEARKAAGRRYPTMEKAGMEPVPGFDLAPGLVVLQTVRVEGREAYVTVLTGPIRSAANLDCGTTSTFEYQRTGGGWEPGEVEMLMC